MVRKTADPVAPAATAASPIAYTPKGFAEQINNGSGAPLSERTVRDWCYNGRLPGAYQIGRRWIIPASALHKLLSDDRGGLSW